MTTSALAAEVTMPEGILAGHSYKAYQVLAGTQAEGKKELGDPVWGNGIDAANFLAALKANSVTQSTFAACSTALDVAKALSVVSDHSAIANEVAKIAYAHKAGEGIALSAGSNELASGYYLIVDATEIGEDADAVYNASLLQVTEHIEIAVKTDKPSVEKKVKENSEKYDEDGGYGAGYNDVADYHIGDAVPFAFYSKVPDMSYYDTYQYVFHDVMSAGLTFNDDVTVTIGGNKLAADKFSVVKNPTDGCTFEVMIADLKAIAEKGQEIRVDFTATLNEDAVIGLDGNPNKVRLEYSNHPDETESTGKTEWDEVIVFTYELDVTKVDKEDQTLTLKNAEFKLRSAEGKWVIVDEDAKVTGWADTEADGSTLTSDADGFFQVIGLDDGTYYLKETKAPSGYNLLTEEIELIIEATTSNGQNWTDRNPATALTALHVKVGESTNVGDVATGSVSMSVVNNKGVLLPETGGIGTTVFYLTGGALLASSTGAFVMKRRSAKKTDEA